MKSLNKISVGRITQTQWLFGMISVIVIAVVYIEFIQKIESFIPFILFDILKYGFIVIGFFFVVSLHVRRLHDLDYSGNFAYFLFVPIINGILLILLLVLPGLEKDNKYGKRREGDKEFFKQIFFIRE